MNEEFELLCDVIQNVDGAFEDLLAMHETNIFFAVRSAVIQCNYQPLYSDEFEELLNIGRQELHLACFKYKDNEKCSFQTFAMACVSTKVKKEIRSRRSNSNQLLNSAVRLDDRVKEGEALYLVDLIENPHREFEGEKILDPFNRDELLEHLAKNLKPIEYKVAELYLDGFRQTQISIELQLPQKRVNYICKKIRNLLL